MPAFVNEGFRSACERAVQKLAERETALIATEEAICRLEDGMS
jgi:isoaspartyl peptidase/L-asparaginase-like protein (Ntn-hydrolase superfamily)